MCLSRSSLYALSGDPSPYSGSPSIFLLTLPIALPMHFLIRSNFGDSFFQKMPYQPRLLNWMIAAWGGLFWMPCPICSKHFGGHEWSECLHTSFCSGQGVCPQCVLEARKRNKTNLASFQKQAEAHYGGIVR